MGIFKKAKEAATAAAQALNQQQDDGMVHVRGAGLVDPAVLEGAETEPEVRPGPIEPGSGDDVGPVSGSAPVAVDGEPPPHPSPGEHPPPSPRLPPAAVEVAGGGDAEAQDRKSVV